MGRYNYGLALSSTGDFQIADTVAGPGIKDDYSRMRSEPFTFFVAPHDWVDKAIHINLLTERDYLNARMAHVVIGKAKLKRLILLYHGVTEQKAQKAPTILGRRSWEDDRQDPQPELVQNIKYR